MSDCVIAADAPSPDRTYQHNRNRGLNPVTPLAGSGIQTPEPAGSARARWHHASAVPGPYRLSEPPGYRFSCMLGAAVNCARRTAETGDVRATTKFKSMLSGGAIVVAPGAFDGLSARLVEQAGFPAVYASGGAIARSTGVPDMGLITPDEIVQRLAEMVEAVS